MEYCGLGRIFVRVLFGFFSDSLRLGVVFVFCRHVAIWICSQTQVILNICESNKLIKFPEKRHNILITTIAGDTIYQLVLVGSQNW